MQFTILLYSSPSPSSPSFRLGYSCVHTWLVWGNRDASNVTAGKPFHITDTSAICETLRSNISLCHATPLQPGLLLSIYISFLLASFILYLRRTTFPILTEQRVFSFHFSCFERSTRVRLELPKPASLIRQQPTIRNPMIFPIPSYLAHFIFASLCIPVTHRAPGTLTLPHTHSVL